MINEIKIKEIIEEFLHKMTVIPTGVVVTFSAAEPDTETQKKLDAVNVEITIQDPQFLIGQNGQTLFELERILRIVLNKKLQESFYLNIDINNYKSKKAEYLKALARDSAESVVLTGEKKLLPPMSAYERIIVHQELSGRQDITAISEGEGAQRRIVISPAGF